MTDLFQNNRPSKKENNSYTAEDIEVLEGLEPVRKRPGMYIGGTDIHALHHLIAEVFDNSMDEAVAGHATHITIHMHEDGSVTIGDNGRGIPVDPHPKFPKKSALEVILTTLHSGGKFSGKVYYTSGGLHGVGVSVVNALTDRLQIQVDRNGKRWEQHYVRGAPQGKLQAIADSKNTGTRITFHPDPEIFGAEAAFEPARVYQLATAKAYLFKGVTILWKCDPELISAGSETPTEATIHFPEGLRDYLNATLSQEERLLPEPFSGETFFAEEKGRMEWAIQWLQSDENCGVRSFCNTVSTPQGGTHEAGLRAGLMRSIRDFAEWTGIKKANLITPEDLLEAMHAVLSLFIPEPQFQGQTKEKLVSAEAQKLVENAIKDHCDHWLSSRKQEAQQLLQLLVERAEDRISRRAQKEMNRKTPTQRLRLPGKLTDCSRQNAQGTELFIVEGDSAGGSAKMARSRETQAVLPIRGKILNVASATLDKIRANQEIADLCLALGCGMGNNYDEAKLRYEKIVIMTDADVDGAHIAALLMTFFYRSMPKLVENGHVYLACPPLYRVTRGTETFYAANDAALEELRKKLGGANRKLEIGRFKGLGEMTASQLKETTMDPAKRTLLKVVLSAETRAHTDDIVEALMGKKPELRFQFIQERSQQMGEKLTDNLDV
jgi:topoisomerase-4 subunit B